MTYTEALLRAKQGLIVYEKQFPQLTEQIKFQKTVISSLEKQIPKKPRKTRCALMCSTCGHKITEIGCKKLHRLYCKKCGQVIDWSDEE